MKHDAIALLKRLSEANGPSTSEDRIIELILESLGDEFAYHVTPHKNLIVHSRRPAAGKTIMLQAHMDELGMRPYRYTSDGFIQLTPTGSVPPDATNHEIIFDPTGVRGILIIQQNDRKSDYYADVGAASAEEAREMVPHYANAAYAGVEVKDSPTHLMGKSFDDRAGCAAITTVLKKWNRLKRNNLVGVFTAREETGNWPVEELRLTMMKHKLNPDIVINVECCPGGPTPGDPNPIARVGGGIVLVSMDASYEPDSMLCRWMEDRAQSSGIPFQHIAVRDGSGELGRIALSFGIAGYPLTIPCRYMHHPHSVISKSDFMACISMIEEIACNYE